MYPRGCISIGTLVLVDTTEGPVGFIGHSFSVFDPQMGFITKSQQS